MSDYNTDLMLAIREQITAHPETHDQAGWAERSEECGTTYCIAGWACVLSGEELDWSISLWGDYWSAFRAWDGANISDKAQIALGLTESEANGLFHSSNWGALRLLDGFIEAGKNGGQGKADNG